MTDIRRLIKAVVGEYELWHMFSIATKDCRIPDQPAIVQPITDFSLLDMPGVDPELRRHRWDRPDALAFCVLINDIPVGICWYGTGELLADRNVGLLPPDEAELIQITISDPYRYRHIGRALIRETALLMRDKGYHRLYAQVWHSNRPSQHAFRAAGWRRARRIYTISPPWLPRPLKLTG